MQEELAIIASDELVLPWCVEHSRRGDLSPEVQRWFAQLSVADSQARLLDAGASAEVSLALGDVFVDLRAQSSRQNTAQSALALLVGVLKRMSSPGALFESECVLVLGGPGEGKSSLTSMAAMLLRQQWITQQEQWDEKLHTRYQKVESSLQGLSQRLSLRDIAPLVPLRVVLPSWMRARAKNSSLKLWDYLATQFQPNISSEELPILAERLERELRSAGDIAWLFDGLDEVPHGASRKAIIEEIQAHIRTNDRVSVTSRPQTYEHELKGLSPVVLAPLDTAQAKFLGDALIRRWGEFNSSEQEKRLETFDRALEDPAIASLAVTALHTTLLATLSSTRKLPRNPAELFEVFFNTLFDRELAKHGAELTEQDRSLLLGLHAIIGLLLHSRDGEEGTSIVLLHAEECAELLFERLLKRRYEEEAARQRAEVLLRFSRERLVLLRRIYDEGYSFGLRSFQEYFAARALLDGDSSIVRERFRAIALDNHWENVLRLAVCELARSEEERALEFARETIVRLCRELSDPADEITRELAVGARLSLRVVNWLANTTAPWITEPLWELVTESLELPVFSTHRHRLFSDPLHDVVTASDDMPIRLRTQIFARAAQLIKDGQHLGWQLLAPFLAKEDDLAEECAQNNAPTREAEARAVAELLLRYNTEWECPTWIARFIATHSSWFSPVWLLEEAKLFPRQKYLSKEHCPAIHIDRQDIRLGLTSDYQVLISWNFGVPEPQPNDADWLLFDQWFQYIEHQNIDLLAQLIEWCSAWEAFDQLFRLNDKFYDALLGALLWWCGGPQRTHECAALIRSGAFGAWSAFSEQEQENSSRIILADLLAQDRTRTVVWDPACETRIGLVLGSKKRVGPAVPVALEPPPPWSPLVFKLWWLDVLELPTDTPEFESFLDEYPLYRTLLKRWNERPAPEPSPAFSLDENSPREDIVDEIRKSTRTSQRKALLSLLARVVVREHSDHLHTTQAWKSLRLPGRSPEEAQRRQAPFVIEELLELRGIRAFNTTPELRGSLPRPQRNEGQWIVLLGENGTGKTTLLRSIALALVDKDTGTKLPSTYLKLLRNETTGHISLRVNGKVFQTTLQKTSSDEEIVAVSENEEAPRPWVVGYGVKRGNALGEPDRNPELRGSANLLTLFDRPATLVFAPIWLERQFKRVIIEQQQRMKGSVPADYIGPAERLWEELKQVFSTLLNISDIDATGDEVLVQHRVFGTRKLSQLSDGYLTTMGWVLDLIARWIHEQLAEKRILPDRILSSMTGVVLIDELDLHLHPIWQMRVIDDLRKHFPKLTFVVTTHNPLTVYGAKRGEVFVLSRQEEQTILLEQKDIRPGSDIDRVLLELFHVQDTLDAGTRTMLDRHIELLRKNDPALHEEKQKLEEKLRERLGIVGQSVLNERMRKTGETPLTHEEKAWAVDRFGARTPEAEDGT